MPSRGRWFVAAALALGALAPSQHAIAEEPVPTQAPRGKPKIVLDRLDFPKKIVGSKAYEKFLKRRLLREAYRADWGAGRGSRIEIRFKVAKLDIVNDGDVLRVSCTAVGRLPNGKVAKSNLSFGGHPSKRGKVVRSVLEIVARGVITRLSELERIRRGDLGHSRVRRPSS